MWTLCSAAERTQTDGQRAVRFWVDAEMLGQLRDHPALHWDGWQEWEIVGCLRVIAAFVNTDPKAQQKALRATRE